MAGLALRRRSRRGGGISIVSMIDVLFILLIFFMVTSTYLDLDMIPATQPTAEDQAASALPEATDGTAGVPAATLLVRIDSEGRAVVAGRRLAPAELTALVAARVAANPALPVVILPSGAARMQDLITLTDAVTEGGAQRLSVLRLAAP